MSVRSQGTTVGTAIIGGGIGGIALAYFLSALGETDIMVVEGGELASGCTGGSLGGVRQQFSTPLEVELAVRGRKFWKTFEETFDYPCTFYQDGYLLVTGRDDVYHDLAEAAKVQRAGGAPNVEMVEARDLNEIVPWLSGVGLIGGCYTPEDGRTNPTDGVHGLAAAARRNGVRIHQGTPVSSIRRGSSWILEAAEPIEAQRVIVACGLGSPALMKPFGLELDIKPFWVHSGITTPVLANQPLPLTVDLDSGLCVEREGDGAIVTILASDSPASYGVEDMLLEFAEAAAVRAPIFNEVSVRTTMSAAADATGGDGHAYIGEVEPGLWTMTGFDGHGTMQGPAIAEFTANLIAGHEDPVLDASVFNPRRIATEKQEWLRASRR